MTGIKVGYFDQDARITVILNQEVADAYRKWFALLWKASKEE